VQSTFVQKTHAKNVDEIDTYLPHITRIQVSLSIRGGGGYVLEKFGPAAIKTDK